MSWDLKLGPNRDLTTGIVAGVDEIIQRLVTRLNRELGEWFLNTSAGLPWYQDGNGLLGSRGKQNLNLLIRRETLQTAGINRIVKFNSIFNTTTRQFAIYMYLVTEQGVVNFTLTEEGASWNME